MMVRVETGLRVRAVVYPNDEGADRTLNDRELIAKLWAVRDGLVEVYVSEYSTLKGERGILVAFHPKPHLTWFELRFRDVEELKRFIHALGETIRSLEEGRKVG